MTEVLQLVDEDLSTILFDFNDSTGANNAPYAAGLKTAFGVGGTFMLNAPEIQFMDFQPSNVPGGFNTLARATIATSSWRQRAYSDSYDKLVAGIGGMNNILRQGGILKWLPTGSSVPKYIDLLPSGATAVFDGREVELLQAITMFDTPPGVTVAVRRQPYLRGAELTPSINGISNPTMLLDLGDNGVPDGWTSVNGTHTIQTADEAYQNSHNNNVDLLRSSTTAASNGQTWTGSIMFRRVSGTGTMRFLVEALDGAVAVVQSATVDSTSSTWTRVSVSLAITDATTASVRLKLRQQVVGGTSVFQFRNAQLEQNTGVSLFRVPSMAVPMEPASTTAGSGPKVFPFYVQGDAQAPVVFTATADSGSAIQRVRFARRSQRRALPDYINSTRYMQAEATGNGWTITLGTDTTGVVDANASPGSGTSAAQIASGGASASMHKRLTGTRTTKLDSLRGKFRVYARVKASAESIWKLQLRWSPSLASPAVNPNDVVTHDLSTDGVPAAFGYVLKELGTISLPTETTVTLAGLALELWARRESGTGTLNIDYLSFIPADERVGTLVVGGVSEEKWQGKELGAASTIGGDPAFGTGTDDGTTIVLANDDEACATPAIALGTGRHTFTFDYRARQLGGVGATTFELRVISTTDSTREVFFRQSFPASERHYNKRKQRTLQFDVAAADSGESYQAQVWLDNVGEGDLRVYDITHTFVPAAGSGEKLRSDPGSIPSRYAVEKLDSSSQVINPITFEGEVPMWCEPGLNVVAIDAEEVPLLYYTEGESKLARVLTVQANYAPRYHA